MAGRAQAQIIGVVVAALLAASCGVDLRQPTSSTSLLPPTTANSPSTSESSLVVPTATPITPSGTVGAPSTVPPAPDPAPASYSDPVTVARAWMAQWCATDWREPINANIERASVFQTPAGKTADLATGDTPQSYQRVVEQQLANRCDQITAEISQEAPAGPNQVYVVVTASRTQLVADRAFQVVGVTSIRSVLRQPDGRWLVDVQVVAG